MTAKRKAELVEARLSGVAPRATRWERFRCWAFGIHTPYTKTTRHEYPVGWYEHPHCVACEDCLISATTSRHR